MRKKDFSNNPALRFITTQREQREADPIPEKPLEDPERVTLQGTRSPEPPEGQISVYDVLGTPKEEKPAPRDESGGRSSAKEKEKRLSEAARDADPGEIAPRSGRKGPEDPPEGYRYTEKKSRRVQIVLRPSTYEKAKQAAKAAGVSFNKFIENAIEGSLKE